MISLKEKFEAIESFTSSFMLKEMTDSEYEKNVADVLQSLSLGYAMDSPCMTNGVKVEIMKKSLSTMKVFDTPFGVRVFPFLSGFPTVIRYDSKDQWTLGALGDFCKIVSNIENGETRENVVAAYHNGMPWVVEIDPALFDNTNGMNPSKIAALILMDFVNVVYSDTIPEMIFDAYTEVYLRPAIYEEKIPPMFALYIVPTVNACINKNWLTIGCPNEAKINNMAVSSDFAMDGLNTISRHLMDAVDTLTRMYGTKIIMSDKVKYEKVKADVEWAMMYSSNFYYNKNKLRDAVIEKGMLTNSQNIRILYIGMLNWLGFVLRLPKDHHMLGEIKPTIFDDPDIMRTYKFGMNTNRVSALTMLNMNYQRHYVSHPVDAATEGLKDSFKRGMRKITGRPPKLPAIEDVDLIFVDVDRVTCHSDRVWVLDKIANCERQIDEFESYYKLNDKNVLNEYRSVIDRMRRRLDTAREEVLDKRSFKKEYRVYVEVPTGYEG